MSTRALLMPLLLAAACTSRVRGEEAAEATTEDSDSATSSSSGSSTLSTSSTSTGSTSNDSTSSSSGTSSTGAQGSSTGAEPTCATDLHPPQPAVLDIGDWPTVEGDLDLQTTCTVDATTEGAQWVARLQCLDPVEATMRPLELRIDPVSGFPIADLADEPVTVDLYHDAIFALPPIMRWLRIADARGRPLVALLDGNAGILWRDYHDRVLPEVSVSPVELGCPAVGVSHAIAFDFDDGNSTIRLIQGDTEPLGSLIVHLFGARDSCDEGNGQCGCDCDAVSYLVLPGT